MIKSLIVGIIGLTSLSSGLAADEEQSFPVYKVDQDYITSLPKQYVALTFDDGPSEYTKEIADILAERGVAGTFFFIGKKLEQHPEIVQYVKAQGHMVGSHSYEHHNLTELTPRVLKNDVLEAVTGLEGLVGHQVELFRPPFGNANEEVVEVVKDQGLKMVMWNRDPEDRNQAKAQDILEYFYTVNSAGGIYILHENPETVEALPQILDFLQSEDLQVVGLQ